MASLEKTRISEGLKKTKGILAGFYGGPLLGHSGNGGLTAALCRCGYKPPLGQGETGLQEIN